MGERLVFKCIKDDKMFATLYFHWSAYTLTGYEEGINIVKNIKERGWTKEKSVTETLQILCDMLENNFSDFDKGYHGGVSGGTNSAEWNALIEMGVTPHEGDHVDRTYGLIDVTEEGMRGALEWAQCIEEINFDEEYFTGGNFVVFDLDDAESREDFFEVYNVDEKYIENIPDLPPMFSEPKISFDEIDKLAELIDATANGLVGKIGNNIYTLIC